MIESLMLGLAAGSVALMLFLGVILYWIAWQIIKACRSKPMSGPATGSSGYKMASLCPKMEQQDWLILVGVVLYVLSPIDVWPEPLGGVFDDMGVIAFAVRHFYKKFWAKKEELPEESCTPQPSRPAIRYDDDDAIDAEFEVRNLPVVRQNQLVRRHG